jgi:C-terminal processing protease CtpA/Prc
VVTSPDTTVRQTEQWAQYFSASNKARYRGQTVLLVDERTGSLAEHTGLLFKAANATTIIGSQTMGANGDISTVVLPGGILVNFTGQAVQWPNGRQLQRIGLQPDIVVRPTVTGIRAGKDEVLDRAIRFIVTGR